MATVNEVCVLTTKADQVKYMTQTNGDELHILNLELSQEQATSLAWLVNSDEGHELQFRIRVKP